MFEDDDLICLAFQNDVKTINKDGEIWVSSIDDERGVEYLEIRLFNSFFLDWVTNVHIIYTLMPFHAII
jgi:hypothetical protein